MHGIKRRRRVSDYGLQLRAKQKAKRIYGVNETQFRNYYLKAKKLKGQLGDNILLLLTRRLDNIVYLSGLCLSRTHAKQLISHRQVLVNGKKLNVSSYLVKIKDRISLSKKICQRFKDSLLIDDKGFKVASWLDLDKKNYSVQIASLPAREHFDQDIDINLIIEYYSR